MINCPKCGHRFSAWKRKFKQKRSRIVSRKDGHSYVFLEGWKDKLLMRQKIFENAGGEVSIIFGQRMDDDHSFFKPLKRMLKKIKLHPAHDPEV